MKSIIAFIILLSITSVVNHEKRDTGAVIRNGIVIDGTGKSTLRGYDILIEDGVIKQIGVGLKVARGVKVIDATGKTVIPGLIDMHGHMYAMGHTQLDAYPVLYIAGGVTTVFSPGEMEPEKTLELKGEIARGERVGPDILSAGPYFDSDPSLVSWMPVIKDTVGLAEIFEKWKGSMDGVKVYSKISREHFDFVIRKAKQHRLMITGHLGTLSTRYAVENGINGLEHGLLAVNDFGGDPNNPMVHSCHIGDLDLTRDDVMSLVQLIVNKNVYIDPTLVILESYSSAFKPIVKDLDFFLDDDATRIQQNYNQWLATLYEKTCQDKQFRKQLEFCKLIFDKGGILVAGTDPVSANVLPGFGIKREIILFVQAGIPLAHAVKIASLNAASVLGLSKQTGSIEVGKNADLSIVGGDVTKNSDYFYATELTMKRGSIYESKPLLESMRDRVHTGYQ
ncbi:MAG TPA: amidohydrolase family protein [Chryseolinea sp.]